MGEEFVVHERHERPGLGVELGPLGAQQFAIDDALGSDGLTVEYLEDPAHGFNAQGGVGCISVTCNVAPRLLREMHDACAANDFAAALAVQDRLMPLHQAIFAEPGLVGAKHALSLLGHCAGDVRLPLVPATEGTRARIAEALRHAGLLG